MNQENLPAGLDAIEEAFSGANPNNLVQQLQHAFRTVARMSADECIVAAQTIRTIAANNDFYKHNRVVLSLANAIRERMLALSHSADNLSGMGGSNLRERFCQAWGHNALRQQRLKRLTEYIPNFL